MKLVTWTRLRRSLGRVRRELAWHGFYDTQVAEVGVRLVTVRTAHGYHIEGERGEIVIPAFSLSKLVDLLDGQCTPLSLVLRHEYGHAIADTHRGLIRSSAFRNAFHAPHDADVEWDYDPEIFVTEYATENPAEDFTEVFGHYLRYGGCLPARLHTPAIRQKWEFVHDLSTAIRRGRRRF
jgi:hypothetical protein